MRLLIKDNLPKLDVGKKGVNMIIAQAIWLIIHEQSLTFENTQLISNRIIIIIIMGLILNGPQKENEFILGIAENLPEHLKRLT